MLRLPARHYHQEMTATGPERRSGTEHGPECAADQRHCRTSGGRAMCQYTELADEDLVDRYYGCDDAAFAELHRRYWPRLVVFFRRFVSAADAEDLAQETLLRLARTKRTGGGRFDRARGTAFAAWLFRIAHNVLQTFWRDQGGEVETVEVAAQTVDQGP